MVNTWCLAIFMDRHCSGCGIEKNVFWSRTPLGTAALVKFILIFIRGRMGKWLLVMMSKYLTNMLIFGYFVAISISAEAHPARLHLIHIPSREIMSYYRVKRTDCTITQISFNKITAELVVAFSYDGEYVIFNICNLKMYCYCRFIPCLV